jgi:hypothetical protein
VTAELDARGFLRLAEPVFAWIAGRELEQKLGRLKDLLESRSAASALSDERVLQGSSRRHVGRVWHSRMPPEMKEFEA